MGHLLHPSATTTAAVRRALQDSQESIRTLAQRYNLNPKTVAKWKKRPAVHDSAMGPKQRRSTVLSPSEEALIVAFRQQTLLPLDDCLYALRESLPHLTRSSLHRCLQRHGLSRLPDILSVPKKKSRFKKYPIGYFHIDIAEVQSQEGKLHLFVAIDRTSKFVYVEIHERATRPIAVDFLKRLIALVPYRLHIILTDNGIQFANQDRHKYAFPLLFDRICHAHQIEHRLTKIKHPWTNGQVERMNRTLKEATVHRYHYDTHEALRGHISTFVMAYNLAKRLKMLKGLTPYEFICQQWQAEPERFTRDPYHLTLGLHSYQKLYDNVINAFIYNIRQYHDAAKTAAKEKVYAAYLEYNSQIKKAGRILKLFTDDSLSPASTFADAQQKAFQILPRQQLTHVADSLMSKLIFDETAFRWDYVDTQSRSFKLRLRPIVLTVDFQASRSHAPLLEAVTFLKEAVHKGKSLNQIDEEEFPLSFVPDRNRSYLYQTNAEGHRRLLVDRYEFLAYRRLWQALEAGHVFCRDSLRFRRLDDDLISEEQWAREKEALIAQTGLSRLQTPIKELLASLKEDLEGQLRSVNERILSGENSHVHMKTRGQHTIWTLPYPRSEDGGNHSFFDEVEQIDIYALMHFVYQQCGFLDVFEHILPRYAKQEAQEQVILACLVAWGTNMGLRRLGAISDIDFQTLTTASDNFLRPQTLKAANDRVTNAIAQLPVFRSYDIAEQLHSSSNGQKFETLIHTLNARYSSKYFGLKKGIVVLTLVANHIPVNADIIGANEHESHYVFDLMYNNVSDVQPTLHSTDTHGTNQVNFAILDFFGKQFAPRYQDIRGKVQTSLYGFQHPSQYPQEWLLKPIRKLNEGLIVREWDTIQRIIVSLTLKTTTQSILVSKLSSHTRRNDIRQALWEYDNILASLYLLKYIDSPPMRRGVQLALNRGESYHHLHRAVSYANFGKLRFKTEYDQHLWSECSRLIANCIIFYNASILSALFLRNQERGHEDPAASLRHISPVAWQHINFYGRFEFASIPGLIDMASIVQAIMARAMPPDPSLEI